MQNICGGGLLTVSRSRSVRLQPGSGQTNTTTHLEAVRTESRFLSPLTRIQIYITHPLVHKVDDPVT